MGSSPILCDFTFSLFLCKTNQDLPRSTLKGNRHQSRAWTLGELILGGNDIWCNNIVDCNAFGCEVPEGSFSRDGYSLIWAIR